MGPCRYDQYADAWDTSVTRTIDGQEVRYFHTKKNGVDRVWIANDAFLAKVPLLSQAFCTDIKVSHKTLTSDADIHTGLGQDGW